MDPTTAGLLLDLNRRFYAGFGAAFAATRRRIQPGVRRVLDALPDDPAAAWLDVGCGSGSLAVEWLRAGRRGAYLGVDFSPALLEEARAAVTGLADAPGRAQVRFALADLGSEDWATGLKTAGLWASGLGGPFAGALCFAVLHHIPSAPLRERVLRQVSGLLPPGGTLALSVWQFQHSPKLMDRRLPWDTVGLAEGDLDPGDTLLDWRYALPGQPEQTGLRYVHRFEPAELAALAQASGFTPRETFESDGQGGRLGLYQLWEKE